MLLVYGANGYTGLLIVDECVRRGLQPIIAGRREETIRPIAEALGVAWRAFSLDDAAAVRRGLEGMRVVLHAAGPFADTSAPMVRGCLDVGVHYLDITGELEVFEACQALDAEAKARDIVVLPGVGFDVVPTDCLAARLNAAMPGGSLLELAFAGGGGPSRGTKKTMQRGQHLGGAVRSEGAIVRVPTAWKSAAIPFRDRTRQSVTIPWGDVSTAYWSTHIPNIHVYLALPSRERPSDAQSAGSSAPVKASWDDPNLDGRLAGPNETVRLTSRMQLWGRVTHADGRRVEGTGETPEGYQLTALSSVEAAKRVLEGQVRSGYQTPSTAFGAGFLEELPGCTLAIGSPTSQA